MSRLHGCTIEPLDIEACRVVMEWVAGGAEPAKNRRGFIWLLAHCRDGVTWGWWDKDSQAWRLSSAPFPDLCPNISKINLLEMRLFEAEGETLIWREEAGFSGRRLTDEPIQDQNSPTRPDDEIRILLGDRLMDGPKDGFTRVRTASGTQQAVPLSCADEDFTDGRWPLRLKLRHYFEKDQEAGAVRVAATRLMDVFKEVS